MSAPPGDSSKRDADDPHPQRPQGSFFGRRKGHALKRNQVALMASLLPQLALDHAHPAPQNLAALFPQGADDVRLEIGFGGGEPLIAQAAANPRSGFIGCEAAASLALRKVSVTLVAPDHLPQEKRLGSAAAERLHDLVSETGARHVGGVVVEEITESGVRLDNGVTIDFAAPRKRASPADHRSVNSFFPRSTISSSA